MASPIRRPASTVFWKSPLGQACTLSPLSGGVGLLEVEIQDDLVAIHSRNCLLHIGDDEDSYIELAEFECSLSLHCCQINWSYAEKEEVGEIERSAYFTQ